MRKHPQKQRVKPDPDGIDHRRDAKDAEDKFFIAFR